VRCEIRVIGLEGAPLLALLVPIVGF
jgi:hypothetical protein